GDQMAVHVPLSMEAQAEARFLMLAANNILKPQDGKPVVSPTQDMVIGCYYLTIERPGAKGDGKYFCSENEAVMAYQCGELALQAPIHVRVRREFEGQWHTRIIQTTLGRLLFNEAIPQNIGFVERGTLDQAFKLEVDFLVGKKDLGKIVDMCYRRYGVTRTAEVLDDIKKLGFTYSTRGAVTVSVADIVVPPAKPQLL
ncbi:MAG TPA: DNA-directed RNA polymerase subunit beta', partial [Clostridia bacterium]|nr:DNA-directed RNA polymerase subunit beta' [Clostridia bacterium]